MSQGFERQSGEQNYPQPFGPFPPSPQQQHYSAALSRHSSGIPKIPPQGTGYSYNPTTPSMSQVNPVYSGQSQQDAVPDPTQNGQFFVGTYEQSPAVQMQRRPSAARSIGGSSVGSSRSIGRSVLGDPGFAPAPKHPGTGSNFEIVKAQYFGEGKEVSSTPPDFAQITHSGTILARISARTMLTKKWKHAFWITYGVHQVLFFRSKNDFEDWLMNPYVTKEERDNYVKLQIDFSSDVYRANVRGYKVTPVQLKDYAKNGMMYQFKLERWMSTGPTIAAAFAGVNENDVKSLFKILQEMVQNSPQKIQDYESDASSFYDSDAGSRGGYFSDGSRATDYSQGSKKSSSGRSWRSNRSDRSLKSNKSGVEIAIKLMDSMKVGRRSGSAGSMNAQHQGHMQSSGAQDYDAGSKKGLLSKFGRQNKDQSQQNDQYNQGIGHVSGAGYVQSTGTQDYDAGSKKGFLSRIGRQNKDQNQQNEQYNQDMTSGPGGQYYQYP